MNALRPSHVSPPSTIVVALALALAAFGCKRDPPPPEALIEGRVVDNFGRPVTGAVISIRDSAFRTTTNPQGAFTIHFVPGTFTLMIEAPHHTSFSRELQVAQMVRYPFGTKMLIRIPNEAASSVLVTTLDGYFPLEVQELARTRVNGRTSDNRIQNCLEYRLGGIFPLLRGNDLSAVFPPGGRLLYRLDNDLVVRESAPDSIAGCPTGSTGIRLDGLNLGDRQFLLAQGLPSGTYCFINVQRFHPLFNLQNDRQAWCFGWENDPSLRWGARVTATVEDQVEHSLGTADDPGETP